MMSIYARRPVNKLAGFVTNQSGCSDSFERENTDIWAEKFQLEKKLMFISKKYCMTVKSFKDVVMVQKRRLEKVDPADVDEFARIMKRLKLIKKLCIQRRNEILGA